jgi:4a-hydroxytetrahydrobiopterin dehydratase
MTEALSEEDVVKYLKLHLKDWSFENNTIKREVKFKTFIEAFSFMTSIALEAEKLDHHPNWSNIYNLVIISLNTHTVKGITQMDLDLANTIDRTYKNYLQAVK